MFKYMRFILQNLMPQLALTRLSGMLAESKLPWLKNILIRYFLSKFTINTAEAVEQDPYAYDSFNALFTRKLKPNARVIVQDSSRLVSPADGTVAQIGYLQNDIILQVKGKKFKLESLLGGAVDADKFINGAFATIYLAPPDYHRVHMPVTGRLLQMVYVPGKLFSVNKDNSDVMPDLFARNERVISVFETEHGRIAVILVGAMLVGSINTTWAGTVNVEHSNKVLSVKYDSIVVQKGEELGYFKMGSTVIVLTEQGMMNWQQELTVGSKVQVGQALGEMLR